MYIHVVKATYPARIGLAEAEALAARLYHEASDALAVSSATPSRLFLTIATEIVKRDHWHYRIPGREKRSPQMNGRFGVRSCLVLLAQDKT